MGASGATLANSPGVADEETLTPPAAAAPTPWFAVVLRQPLSTVQTVVGILAGLLTIGGGFLSFSGFAQSAPAPHQGEIVAVVHDVRSSKPLTQATVEIFTPQDAIVTTLNVEPDGHLARRLKEGRYRLRVTHPGFLTEVRHVEVHSGQRSDIRIALGPRPPAPRVTKAVAEEPGPVTKFFREVFGQ
jgi:carboxypeptidase family protein